MTRNAQACFRAPGGRRSTVERRPEVWGLVVAIALSAGCAPGLRVTRIAGWHGRPSNVSLFLTVDDPRGQAVAGLEADDFRVFEDGAIVPSAKSRQTVVRADAAADYYTMLLVDMSGDTAQQDPSRIADAVEGFLRALEGAHRVAVLVFDGSEEPHAIQAFDGAASVSARREALAGFRPKDPSTNLFGAVARAVSRLETTLAQSTKSLSFGTLVVVAEGADRAARVPLDHVMDDLEAATVNVYAVGVGDEVDSQVLSRLGFSGWASVGDAAGMELALETVAERIAGHTQSSYLFTYCSPARAGIHEVRLEASRGEGSGSLTYRFDATGFDADCDPATKPTFDAADESRVRARRGQPRLRGRRLAVDVPAVVADPAGTTEESEKIDPNRDASGPAEVSSSPTPAPTVTPFDPERGDY